MWGKRSGTRSWNQISSSWGKRNVDDEEPNQDDQDSDYFGNKRSSWNKISPMWGKRDGGSRPLDLDMLADELEKRAQGWNNLNGAWGKRSSGSWKHLNGAWGKRQADQHHKDASSEVPAGSSTEKDAGGKI
jgi:hypothetical protein